MSPFLQKIVAFLCASAFFFCVHNAHAATVIYRSVAVSATSALDTGSADSNSLTISGDTATFSIAVPENVGVGDAIQYDSDNNGSIDSIVFIHARASSTSYTVKNYAGSNATSTSASDTDWSIYRSYTSIHNAFSGIENTGINATVRSFDSDTNTRNVVTSDEQWNFAFYGNGTSADGGSNPQWTTSATTYIRLFTATSTSEVGVSQRHAGVFDSSKYFMYASQYGIQISTAYMRIDGLQMNHIHYYNQGDGEYQFSNNIVDGVAMGGSADYVQVVDESGGNTKTIKFWNNIFANGVYGFDLRYSNGTITFFNNTYYNFSGGAYFVGPGSNTTLKNNLFASTTKFCEYCSTPNVASDYNSTSLSTIGYGSGGLGNTHDKVNQTFSFFDIANYDYHLTALNTGAINQGVDLSADASLAFSTDIEGETRPQSSAWDIGADEYTVAPDITAPGRSAGSPSTEVTSGSTSVNLSLNTNENATCKYSTTANTAYSSMTNTFSTTGGTSHSTNISGISDGHLYHYYVRCEDASGNSNSSDYDLSFAVEDSGIVYSDSCSVADVNAAYYYAEAGDTLKIPAGVCTGWSSSSGLGIYKAITVEGAGRGQTIIEIASTSGSYSNAIIPIGAAATVKSLTIRTETSGPSGTAFSASANGFRITDVEYLERTTTNTGYFLIANSVYGLVDYNYINGNTGSTELIFARGPSNSWTTDNSLGKSENLFIENNTFSSNGYVSDCNSHARCVVRNNLITAQQKVDGHGLATNSFQAPTQPRGVREMEVYNNTWTASPGSWAAMELRGGTGMIFSNTAAGGNLILNEYGASGAYSNFGFVVQTSSNYPINDQIGVGKDPKAAASEPMYMWNNTRGGSIWSINLGYGQEALLGNIIMPNRDYYMSSTTAFDGTASVGSGTLSSKPSTCTTGVGYFATDGGMSWNAQNGTSSDGTFFKCTSTNTWTEYYTPYALPHYLAATSSIGTTTVDIGAGARMFGNGFFYDIATSSKTHTYADMAVFPGSTTNAWVDVHILEWQNSGTRLKKWKESMPSLNSTSTYHVIGDLSANEIYEIKVDDVVGVGISGPNCSSGVCTSNGAGEVIFTYSGGYSEHEFQVEQASPDTTGPVISSVASTTGQTTATITWTTDESASSTVSYGASSSYGSASTSATLTTSHSITLTGLTAATVYHFNVGGSDAAGNISTSSDYMFTTTATPDITGPVLAEVSAIGTTDDTTPNYIFSSTEIGPITYGGSCTSDTSTAAVGSNSIIFSRLGNGIYSDCTIVVTDVSLNASDPLFVTLFTINASTGGGGGGRRSGGSSLRMSNSLVQQSNIASTYFFTRDLTLGSVGEDVAKLQEVLISGGYLVLPHNISKGYFGRLTQSALSKYQISNGISPASGYFGPVTRGFVNKVVPTSVSVQPQQQSIGFTRDLNIGSVGEDVRMLQKFLNEHMFTIASTGPGSPGNETTTFGRATQYQLIQFQKAHNIIPAAGYFGPKTLNVIVNMVR